MKRLTNILALAILVLLGLTIPSCKKSDPAPADPAKILEGKNWRMTALTVDPANNGITDVFGVVYDPCEQDDIYQFKTGNIFALDNGPTKCDPGDEQSTPGTWSYNNTSKILRITITNILGSYDLDYTLKEINDDNFKTQLVVPDMGITYTYTATFQKQ